VDGGEAAAIAEWTATLFAGHVAKVNDLLLPALAGSGADLAACSPACTRRRPARKRDATGIVPEGGENIMYPNSALSAGQLAIMAVVVVASLAAWLIAVFLAARQPRGTSAAVNAGPHEEETAQP